MRPKCEYAVSPVVGVMLMLVVTIIIAAVVSGFAGGLLKTTQNAPHLNMDVKIINTGSWAGSGFFATITAANPPIPTSDLKIVTSWTAENGGNPISGGNTTLPNVQNVKWWFDPTKTSFGERAVTNVFAPFGMGPGVNRSYTVGYSDTNVNTFTRTDQQYGNYTLYPGTTLQSPCAGAAAGQVIGGTWVVNPQTGAAGSIAGQGILGSPSSDTGYGVYTRYVYSTALLDPATAILGANWEKLRAGDRVNIKVIHIPTGKVIYDQNIPVTESTV